MALYHSPENEQPRGCDLGWWVGRRRLFILTGPNANTGFQLGFYCFWLPCFSFMVLSLCILSALNDSRAITQACPPPQRNLTCYLYSSRYFPTNTTIKFDKDPLETLWLTCKWVAGQPMDATTPRVTVSQLDVTGA